MKKINSYIIEKLKINKDSKYTYEPQSGDIVVVINFLSGDKDCILNVAKITGIFTNTIVIEYDSRKINATRMFILTDESNNYFGKSKNGDLIMSEEQALNALTNINDNEILDKYNIVTSDIKEYINFIKKRIKNAKH